MTSPVDRKAWGKYLQDEQKYDKWGALGKILVIQEVLSEDAAKNHPVPKSADEIQQMTNEVFPRTFFCERRRVLNKSLVEEVLRYYNHLSVELADRGLHDDHLRSTVLEETAEKFCLPLQWISEMTNVPGPR